jgi:hypothetical protein
MMLKCKFLELWIAPRLVLLYLATTALFRRPPSLAS